MIKRRDIGAKTLTVTDGGEDELTRFVRLIARQAAQEAFALFKDTLETRSVKAPAQLNRSRQTEDGSDSGARDRPPSPASDERSLSVQKAAARLDVSEKTIRRKIKLGELPAHRVGKLLRISERDLFRRPTGDHSGAVDDE